jgi:hypothetical protein
LEDLIKRQEQFEAESEKVLMEVYDALYKVRHHSSMGAPRLDSAMADLSKPTPGSISVSCMCRTLLLSIRILHDLCCVSVVARWRSRCH